MAVSSDMSLHKNSYLGHSAGIHSIQEKDDVLEQDGNETNFGYDVKGKYNLKSCSNVDSLLIFL